MLRLRLVEAERTEEAGAVVVGRLAVTARVHDGTTEVTGDDACGAGGVRVERHAVVDGVADHFHELHAEGFAAVEAREFDSALVHLQGTGVATLALLGDVVQNHQLVGGEARAAVAQGDEDGPLVGDAAFRVGLGALLCDGLDEGEFALVEFQVCRVHKDSFLFLGACAPVLKKEPLAHASGFCTQLKFAATTGDSNKFEQGVMQATCLALACTS